MAKLFIGIALVVMLATAALSFLAKGNIDKLQTSLKETKGRVAGAEVQAKNAKAEAEKAKTDLAAADEKAKAADAAAAAATAAADASKKEAADAKAQVETENTKIADLQKQIDDLIKGPKPVQQDDPRLAELQGKLDAAQKELTEAKQVSETESNKVKEMEAKLSDADKKERLRAQQFTKSGLQGRILAVNGGWNFVVLSVGDKQGVVVNSSLLVVRGAEPVARLRVTSVEPSTSIADVLPGSVRKGLSVQPGDTVIFEGARSQAAQPAAKAAPEVPATTGTIAPLPN